MKKIKEFYNKLSYSTRISINFILLLTIIVSILYLLLPEILNYPPNSINTELDKQVTNFYYFDQFFIIFIFIFIFSIIVFKLALKEIDHWQKEGPSSLDQIRKIRQKCLHFPYYSYLMIELFCMVFGLFILQLKEIKPIILTLKMYILIFSFSTLLASIFLIVSKKILYPVLKETSSYLDKITSKRSLSFQLQLVFQMFPGILVAILLVCFIGYSKLVQEKGNLLNHYYNNSLNTVISQENTSSFEEIVKTFSPNFLTKTDCLFLISPNGDVITSNGSTLSSFFLTYMKERCNDTNRRVYDAYAIDAQGTFTKIQLDGQEYLLGVYYEVCPINTFFFFVLAAFILFLLTMLLLIYFIDSTGKDIEKVNKALTAMLENKDHIKDFRLPITSDDILRRISCIF